MTNNEKGNHVSINSKQRLEIEHNDVKWLVSGGRIDRVGIT